MGKIKELSVTGAQATASGEEADSGFGEKQHVARKRGRPRKVIKTDHNQPQLFIIEKEEDYHGNSSGQSKNSKPSNQEEEEEEKSLEMPTMTRSRARRKSKPQKCF